MPARQTASYLIRKFKEAGIRPDTRHGQNFLIDLNLLKLLAETAEVGVNDIVLEVGTGTGSLTALLAQRANAVVTVEIHGQLFQLAKEILVDCKNVTMLQMDALKNKNNLQPELLQLIQKQLAESPHRQLKLVANLPYNVATPVISNLLATEILPKSITVTIQKELADRITARPGTKDYSALSVWIQCQCDARIVRVLGPSAFWPRPKVHSAIIQICPDPVRRNRIRDRVEFHTFTRSLFFHRRKLLRRVLLSAYKNRLSKPDVDDVLNEMKLRPDSRAEQLSVDEMHALLETVNSRLTVSGQK